MNWKMKTLVVVLVCAAVPIFISCVTVPGPDGQPITRPATSQEIQAAVGTVTAVAEIAAQFDPDIAREFARIQAQIDAIPAPLVAGVPDAATAIIGTIVTLLGGSQAKKRGVPLVKKAVSAVVKKAVEPEKSAA